MQLGTRMFVVFTTVLLVSDLMALASIDQTIWRLQSIPDLK